MRTVQIHFEEDCLTREDCICIRRQEVTKIAVKITSQ